MSLTYFRHEQASVSVCLDYFVLVHADACTRGPSFVVVLCLWNDGPRCHLQIGEAYCNMHRHILFSAFPTRELVCCWASIATIRRLLYATQQHTSTVQNSVEAVAALSRCIAQHNQQGTFKSGSSVGPNATEDLLNANVLPHLSLPQTKVHFLAHLVGVLLNYLFTPAARRSMQYDNVGKSLVLCFVVFAFSHALKTTWVTNAWMYVDHS